MARNVEIKARVHDPAALERRAAEIADGPPETLDQRDVFFRTERGRLKLRCFAGGAGELICYDRPDQAGPKTSSYVVVPAPAPDELEAALTAALGVRGVVRKRRRLYLHGPTRIHLDRVEDLGDFMELEVVLKSGQTAAEGRAVARDLMRRLGIAPGDLVEAAYVDLLTDSR